VFFRNRIALFLWGFAAVFILFLTAMTYIYYRDGLPTNYSPDVALVVIVVLWLGGIGLVTYVSGKPCIFVTVIPNKRILIIWQYPFKKVRREVSCKDITPAVVVESRDDEDNPYFYARVSLSDGEKFDITESHDRKKCEVVCTSFNLVLSDTV
jgi:hypothetical protein